MYILQGILAKCETLQNTIKTGQAHEISFDTEIANWPLDKDAADVNLDEKTPHSNWSEFGDISNDDVQGDQLKDDANVNELSEIHMIVMASAASESPEKNSNDHVNSYCNEEVNISNDEIMASNDKVKSSNSNDKVKI